MTHREKDGEKGRREAQKEFLCVGMCGCVSLSFAPHLRFRVQQLSFDCQQTPLSLSLLSHCLEHQTQPPTPVTPVSLLMSPYPLEPSTDNRHLVPYPCQCSTSFIVGQSARSYTLGPKTKRDLV